MSLGPVWGWTWADPAATPINAVALTIGVVIGASTLQAQASKTESQAAPAPPALTAWSGGLSSYLGEATAGCAC